MKNCQKVSTPMFHDYVVQTKSRSVADMLRVKVGIEAKGFLVTLLTTHEEIRYGRDKRKRMAVLAPAFPGYLFVRMDLERDPWRDVQYVRGVKCLMGGDSPRHLPDGELERWQEWYPTSAFCKPVVDYRINAGDPVTITSGPFEGAMGVCLISRGERVRVMLGRLWGSLKVDMGAELVRVAS